MTSLLSPPLSPSQSAPAPETTPASKGAPEKKAADTAPDAPLPTFDVLPLSADVRATLAEMGYVHPTPVQIAVFEPAKRGKDLVVQARTGTGKTAAFGLPIVDHIVKRSVEKLQVLVLTPTRELALQVGAEIERLGKRRGVRVTAIYGGAPMQRQIDAMAAGAQVISGTPGRVLDHLRRGTLDPKNIRLVVLDESDEMLSMGFERELNAILEHLPSDRQTLLFSATLPPDIERIAKNKLRTPEFVTLSGDHVGALSILHFVYLVNSDKTTAFLRMVEVDNPESAIVFCNTKDETERLASALQRQGFEADWLNGDLDQGEREKVMSATREGRIRFLVATDVAARGIDISHLTHVINFDFPQDAESYVHRTGRTGRAGKTGTAISLVTPRDIGQLYLLRLTYKIRPVEKQIPSDHDLKTRAETDLVAMFAEAYGKSSAHPDDLAIARRLMTHDNADAIIAGLLRDHLGARPTVREESSAARRAARPKPAGEPPSPRDSFVPRVPQEPRAARRDRAERGTSPSEATTVEIPRVTREARPAAPPAASPAAPVVTPAAPAAIAPALAPAPVAVAPVAAAATPVVVGVEEELRLPAPSPAATAPSVEIAVAENAPVATPDAAAPADLPAAAAAGEGAAAPGAGARSGGDRYGRGRDDRRGGDERGRRGRDRGPRDFSDGARDRAAASRPLDRARPLSEGAAPPAKAFVRHADFTTWQPPEEEGDDEPIWGGSRRAPDSMGLRGAPSAPGAHVPHSVSGVPHGAPDAPSADDAAMPREPRHAHPHAPAPEGGAPGEAASPPGEVVELHVTVGRRDGARAADLVRALEKAGLPKDSVQRVRVRERHAFLTVRKEDEERALAALNGTVISGRTASAERARERGGPVAPSSDTPVEPNGGGDPME